MVQQTVVRRRRGVHQWLALIVGLVYLVVGIAGFVVTGFDFSDVGRLTEHDPDQTLLGFAVNPLHNIVHLVIGILGLLMWPSRGAARTYGWLLFVGYGLVFVYGLLAVNDQVTDILNINDADNWLHLGSALVGLLIALLPAPREVVSTAPVYQDPAYRDPTYGDPDYRDPRTQDPAYRDPAYRDPSYRDPDYRDPDYPDLQPGDPNYRDPNYRDPDYPDRGRPGPG